MTVYEYALANDLIEDEIEVIDLTTDDFWYAYPEEVDPEADLFFQACARMWKYLEIVPDPDGATDPDCDWHVFVDMYGLIERRLPALKKEDLFNSYNVETIMSDMNAIFSGYVGENWMDRFVSVLTST